MRSGNIVKGLKEYYLFFEVFSFLAETENLSRKWGQRLTERQIQPLQQGCADLSPHFCKPICSTLNAMGNADNSASFCFFDHLTIN